MGIDPTVAKIAMLVDKDVLFVVFVAEWRRFGARATHDARIFGAEIALATARHRLMR